VKFFMYSNAGEGAQILNKIRLEGNDVALFIKDPIYKNVFDGILDKADLSWIDQDTVIIFDMSGFGKLADDLRKKGHHVYGASEFSDKLEHDRNFGFQTMRESRIKVPIYEEFKRISDAISYIKHNPDIRFVFKPNGDMPCKLTYVADDNIQLIEYLKFIERRFSKEIKSFILQEFIDGAVVSSEFYCSAGELLWPPNHTVEVKKSMNNDLGPSTGCSGNITWNSGDTIIQNGIFKMKEVLRREQFTGQLDLNAVVNKEGVFGLEWTPRFGYDATPTYLTLLDMEYAQFFSDVARGQHIGKLISHTEDYAASIRLSIPPYPMETKFDTEKFSPNEGIPIQNWEEYESDIYFYEVMMEGDTLVHSGGTGVICLGLGTGETPEKALATPCEIMEKVKVPDKQYRTDLEEVLSDMVKEICEYDTCNA